MTRIAVSTRSIPNPPRRVECRAPHTAIIKGCHRAFVLDFGFAPMRCASWNQLCIHMSPIGEGGGFLHGQPRELSLYIKDRP